MYTEVDTLPIGSKMKTMLFALWDRCFITRIKILYCIVLYCIVLYCIVVYSVVF